MVETINVVVVGVPIFIIELKRVKPCDLRIREDNINPELYAQSFKMDPF